LSRLRADRISTWDIQRLREYAGRPGQQEVTEQTRHALRRFVAFSWGKLWVGWILIAAVVGLLCTALYMSRFETEAKVLKQEALAFEAMLTATGAMGPVNAEMSTATHAAVLWQLLAASRALRETAREADAEKYAGGLPEDAVRRAQLLGELALYEGLTRVVLETAWENRDTSRTLWDRRTESRLHAARVVPASRRCWAVPVNEWDGVEAGVLMVSPTRNGRALFVRPDGRVHVVRDIEGRDGQCAYDRTASLHVAFPSPDLLFAANEDLTVLVVRSSELNNQNARWRWSLYALDWTGQMPGARVRATPLRHLVEAAIPVKPATVPEERKRDKRDKADAAADISSPSGAISISTVAQTVPAPAWELNLLEPTEERPGLVRFSDSRTVKEFGFLPKLIRVREASPDAPGDWKLIVQKPDPQCGVAGALPGDYCLSVPASEQAGSCAPDSHRVLRFTRKVDPSSGEAPLATLPLGRISYCGGPLKAVKVGAGKRRGWVEIEIVDRGRFRTGWSIETLERYGCMALRGMSPDGKLSTLYQEVQRGGGLAPTFQAILGSKSRRGEGVRRFLADPCGRMSKVADGSGRR
jgi:hypothetical protein